VNIVLVVLLGAANALVALIDDPIWRALSLGMCIGAANFAGQLFAPDYMRLRRASREGDQ